jgi:NAD(P)-dependent dehydrogenase (short-subunit alcohol dehydrogenase family)
MNLHLENKVTLITGSSAGIGFAATNGAAVRVEGGVVRSIL